MKYAVMVQITVFRQFLLLLFQQNITLPLYKPQQHKLAPLWTLFIVFMGSFLAVSNITDQDHSSFHNNNLAKVYGIMIAWLSFQILRPSSDKSHNRRQYMPYVGIFATS
ncbi:Fusaric acid resistance protein family protein [Izhakiella capsodis]|uniref:Fusaric acid resistance protein family protein n=1 Tax=Izhakiella capsodis TaxID=1367852 RepID=A0A1I4Z825_9GAMM|nr:Fusaric acid resistance protein family protein [Izhakiella capsodis]